MPDIAISNLAWDKSADQQMFEVMQDIGTRNLEVSPFRDATTPLEAKKLFDSKMPKLLSRYGIKIVAFQSLLFRHPDLSLFKDEITRKETLRHLIEVLELANSVGATDVVFGSPKSRIKGELSHEEALDVAKSFFEELANQARRLNITFCIEPAPSVYGADFVCDTNEALEFAREVDHGSLKINLDIGSLILNDEKVEEIIPANIKYIGHVHVSEPYLQRVDYKNPLHRSVAQALKGGGYEGVVSIEMLPSDKLNLEYMKELISTVKRTYE